MNVSVIVNPKAGTGSAARTLDLLLRALSNFNGTLQVQETLHRGDATRLAMAARDAGAEVIVAIGGDGTFNEVSQALITADGLPISALAEKKVPDLVLIPAGTGSDLHRTLELDVTPEAVLERLKDPHTRALDLGIVEFRSSAGDRQTRAFLNVASCGFSARVASMVNNGPKWLGGQFSYLGAALKAAMGHQKPDLRLKVDGQLWYSGRVVLAAFGNSRYFGGGMRIAPGADPSDGMLDCVLLGDLSRLQTYALTSHIYGGTHLSRTGVQVCQGTEFEVESILPDELVEIEIDGETPGFLPARVRILPGAVRLRCKK